MNLSATDLWTAFIAYCGDREPTPELMRSYARGVAGYGNPSMFELRVGTVMAILRTRLACNRHFTSLREPSSDARDAASDQRRAHRLRSALTLAHLSTEIVDSTHD